HNDRQWVRGQDELSDSYRGVKYYFSNSESLKAFQKDPGRFAPRNFGCDPVVLVDSNRAITGKIQYGAFFDNQLFLFETAENRTEFKKNPLKFTKIRHAIRIQDVEGTRIR
ncbi:MAG: hypothetical protein JNL58_21765, partial [Planctomyces sp.]|nr:hypothetical protein [Planctomyces sp.]